ncbi:MAG: acetate--CoA ligase family protein [Anaerolineales bacterium]|nr:acetate--CoA ligase family protein [Anaerolineales bacterium]
MAKLHEAQGKTLLREHGIRTPEGALASTPEEARQVAQELSRPVVVKGQAWVTGRADRDLIRFAADPENAQMAASEILGRLVAGQPVEQVLVEEQVDCEREFYAGVIIDDQAQSPLLIFSSMGGTGIETIARSHPERIVRQHINVKDGLPGYEARNLVRSLDIHGKLLVGLGNLLASLYESASAYDARSAEINPIALTRDGKLLALDCRMTIDDNAAYRHPDLGIEVAREYDRPPTRLERIAWQVEAGDYRGTFYFIQMEYDYAHGDGVIGFHGAGGGGSMMSMDAVINRGYKLANFVDTSGNPPASKVYRAARIILNQGPIDGYFASGSGVASQEQFHSARGLVKAFMEEPLTVPAVLRLGGNAEQRAIAIIERAQAEIPAPVEAYGKDDSPEKCAERLDFLISSYSPPAERPTGRFPPDAAEPYQFSTITGGTVTLDHAACRRCDSKICLDTCIPQILSLEENVPVLNISREQAHKGGCIECLACQVECYFEGNRGGSVLLPIEGL